MYTMRTANGSSIEYLQRRIITIHFVRLNKMKQAHTTDTHIENGSFFIGLNAYNTQFIRFRINTVE